MNLTAAFDARHFTIYDADTAAMKRLMCMTDDAAGRADTRMPPATGLSYDYLPICDASLRAILPTRRHRRVIITSRRKRAAVVLITIFSAILQATSPLLFHFGRGRCRQELALISARASSASKVAIYEYMQQAPFLAISAQFLNQFLAFPSASDSLFISPKCYMISSIYFKERRRQQAEFITRAITIAIFHFW